MMSLWSRVAMISLSVLAALPATAAVLRVPSEYESINCALANAAPGDSVLVAAGTYSQVETRLLSSDTELFYATSVAFLERDVSVIAEGGRDVTRIDLLGQSGYPVVGFELGGTALVQGFTITGAGVGNPGVFSNSFNETGRVVIRDCRFEGLDGGASSGLPGGVYSYEADLEIFDSEFAGVQGGYASALSTLGGDVILERCRFEGCGPGAVALLDNSNTLGIPNGAASIRDCQFLNNTAYSAIYSFLTAVVEGCEFVGTGTTALALAGVAGGTGSMARNLFALSDAAAAYPPAAVVWWGVAGIFEENTVVGSGAHGLWLEGMSAPVTVRRNIFASTVGAAAVRLAGSSSAPPVSECNDFWNNPAGDTQGYLPGPTDLFLDPYFCGEATGDYTLSGASPCLPANSGSCGLIGALDQGCGVVSVTARSWGLIKSGYR